MIFTQEEYERYEDVFNNATDKRAFFDRYYESDIVFIRLNKGTFGGKDERVGFWNSGINSGHDGIHEILHLKNFIAIEDEFAVELDVEWRFFKHTDNLGPRKKGDVFWGCCAGFYDLKDNKNQKVSPYLNLAKSDDQAD